MQKPVMKTNDLFKRCSGCKEGSCSAEIRREENPAAWKMPRHMQCPFQCQGSNETVATMLVVCVRMS